MNPRFSTPGRNCHQLGDGKAAGGGSVGRMEFPCRQCAHGLMVGVRCCAGSWVRSGGKWRLVAGDRTSC